MKTHRPLCQNFNKIYSLIDRYKIRGKNLIKDKIKILIISLRATDRKLNGKKNVLSQISKTSKKFYNNAAVYT